MESQVKIFAGQATEELATRIAESYGQPIGKVERYSFSDGELQTSYEESIRGHSVFIVQSTMPSADNLMELLLLIDAAKRASARHIVAVIPYYGYARQDRKDKPRVAIGAKLVADMLTVHNKPYVATDSAGRVYVTDPEQYRVLIFDADGNYLYWPGTPQFDQVNSFYYTTYTLRMFERYARRTLSWSFPSLRITVDPHVGHEANAFYSEQDRMLGFHSFNHNGEVVSTAWSADIVSHEAGHAMHSFYSNASQAFHNAGYPIFLAEIASLAPRERFDIGAQLGAAEAADSRIGCTCVRGRAADPRIG